MQPAGRIQVTVVPGWVAKHIRTARAVAGSDKHVSRPLSCKHAPAAGRTWRDASSLMPMPILGLRKAPAGSLRDNALSALPEPRRGTAAHAGLHAGAAALPSLAPAAFMLAPNFGW